MFSLKIFSNPLPRISVNSRNACRINNARKAWINSRILTNHVKQSQINSLSEDLVKAGSAEGSIGTWRTVEPIPVGSDTFRVMAVSDEDGADEVKITHRLILGS